MVCTGEFAIQAPFETIALTYLVAVNAPIAAPLRVEFV